MKDLVTSPIDRQNILNNKLAVENIQEHLGVQGLFFEGELWFTRNQVAEFYGIDLSTIDRYLLENENELRHNGYVNLKGEALRAFKEQFGWILQVSTKTSQLGVFNFRSFLNLGMLLSESEKAKTLRSVILDIVIDTLNQKIGGSAKFINQRDEDFFVAIVREPHYRKEFTSALSRYLEMGNYKYALYTDAIYKAVFHENASEYKLILQIEEKENPRDTMYAEVLKLISSFENGIAFELQKESKRLKRKLYPAELDELIRTFSGHPLYVPYLEDARSKMASRDYGFRNIIHDRLKNYIRSLSADDYERFLGDKSKDFLERVEENIEVFKRLKDR